MFLENDFLVLGVSRKEVYDIIQMINKFSRIRSASLFEDMKTNPFNFIQGLRGTDNVYTQHRPFLSKEILPDIIKGKARPDLEYLCSVVEATVRPIVVFVVGGVTYEESRSGTKPIKLFLLYLTDLLVI